MQAMLEFDVHYHWRKFSSELFKIRELGTDIHGIDVLAIHEDMQNGVERTRFRNDLKK